MEDLCEGPGLKPSYERLHVSAGLKGPLPRTQSPGLPPEERLKQMRGWRDELAATEGWERFIPQKARDGAAVLSSRTRPFKKVRGVVFVLSVNPFTFIPQADSFKLGGTNEITQRNHGLGSSHEEGVLAGWRCFFRGDCLAGGQQTANGYDHFRKLRGLRVHAGKGQKEQTDQRRGALPRVCRPHRRHRLPHPAAEALRQALTLAELGGGAPFGVSFFKRCGLSTCLPLTSPTSLSSWATSPASRVH